MSGMVQPKSPLPWSLVPHRDAHIASRHGDVVTDVGPSFDNTLPCDEDAAYIIAACNNYPALLAAVRTVVDDFKAKTYTDMGPIMDLLAALDAKDG